MSDSPEPYFILGMLGVGFYFYAALHDQWLLFAPALLLTVCCQMRLLLPFVQNYKGKP